LKKRNEVKHEMKQVVLQIISFYQKYVAPIKGPTCRFYPTCSQYTYDAVKKYGIIKGTVMGMKRILCCHPFHPGGYDPVK